MKIWDTKRSVKWVGPQEYDPCLRAKDAVQLSLPKRTCGTLSRHGDLKSKKLLCLEGEIPERGRREHWSCKFPVGPVPAPVPSSKPVCGGGDEAMDSQEKFWGILRKRDLTLLKAPGDGVEVAFWRLVASI